MKKVKTKQVKVLRWLDMGIFPATVLFSCGFSYDELMKILKKKKADGWATGISQDKALIDDGIATTLKRHVSNSKVRNEVKYYYLIFNKSFDYSDYSYCILAHEILHICQFFLPDVLNRDREYEAEAYLHTYLMEKCLKVLRG